jgi:putative ubiquitin-RnfH superfamily antitoxin RatB of RatAB toxin-antitoxin module
MKVSVAYTGQNKQVWLHIQVPEGSTVTDAINHSGILSIFPEIDLTQQKLGIFGKLTKADAQLNEGDRVEIYRAIIADPKTVKRRDKDGDDEDDD